MSPFFKRKLNKLALSGVVIMMICPWLQLWLINHISLSQCLSRIFLALLLVISLTITASVIKSRKLAIALQLLVVGTYSLICNMEFFMFYCQGESFNDSFFIHFKLYEVSTGYTSYLGLGLNAAFYFATTLALSFFPFNVLELKRPHKLIACSWLIFFIYMFTGDNASKNLCMKSYEVYIEPALLESKKYIASDTLKNAGIKPGVSPEKLKAKPGKNLVFIFWESMSQAYLDERSFPGLLPNTRKLIKESLFFSEMKPTLNANNTFSGIYSTLTGIPLFYNRTPSRYVNSKKNESKLSMSDILHKAGYHQVFMRGASGQFANTSIMVKKNSFDEVIARIKLSARKGKIEYNTWGVRDRYLYRFALDEFNKLAESGKPFNLTLLSLDTHGGAGFPSGHFDKYEHIPDNSMLNAVYEADYNLYNFIEGLKKSPAWKNTVVWVVADHPVGYSLAEKYMTRELQGKMICFCLNSGEAKIIDTPAQNIDLPATVLASIEVEYNHQFPIGENLLDSPKSDRFKCLESPGKLKVLKQYSQAAYITGRNQ